MVYWFYYLRLFEEISADYFVTNIFIWFPMYLLQENKLQLQQSFFNGPLKFAINKFCCNAIKKKY